MNAVLRALLFLVALAGMTLATSCVRVETLGENAGRSFDAVFNRHVTARKGQRRPKPMEAELVERTVGSLTNAKTAVVKPTLQK